MALTVRLKTVPKGRKHKTTSYAVNREGSLGTIPPWQVPWVLGDLHQILGYLEGLAGAAIHGWIEIAVHEGLTSINADLDVYDARTCHNLEILVPLITRIIAGIAAQVPRTNLRIKANYSVTWSN